MPETRFEHRRPRETVERAKRCDAQLRTYRLPSSSTGRDVDRAGAVNHDADIVSGEYTDNPRALATNTNYSAEDPSTATRAGTRDGNEELRPIFEDDASGRDANSDSPVSAKAYNAGRYLCRCEERDLPPRTGSSRTIPRRNCRGPTARDGAKPIPSTNISRRESSKRYREDARESGVLGLINLYPANFRTRGGARNILYAPVLYEIQPRNLAPHAIPGKGRKFTDIGVPFLSSDGESDLFVGGDARNPPTFYQSSKYRYPYEEEEERLRVTVPSTASSFMSDIDGTGDAAAVSDPTSCCPKGTVGEARNKYSSDSTRRVDFDPTDSSKKASGMDFFNAGETTFADRSNDPEPAGDVEPGTNEINEGDGGAEIVPKPTATVSPVYVGSIARPRTGNNIRSHSSSDGNENSLDGEPSKFTATPDARYVAARIDSGDERDSNYAETIARDGEMAGESKSVADTFDTVALSRTVHYVTASPKAGVDLDSDDFDRETEDLWADESRGTEKDEDRDLPAASTASSAVRVPEYVMQTRESTTASPSVASALSVGETELSSSNEDENLESTDAEANADIDETSRSDDAAKRSGEYQSADAAEDARLTKKLTGKRTDRTAKATRSQSLGRSESRTSNDELLDSNRDGEFETASSPAGEPARDSTSSAGSNADQGEDRSATVPKTSARRREKSTTASYDRKTRHRFEDKTIDDSTGATPGVHLGEEEATFEELTGGPLRLEGGKNLHENYRKSVKRRIESPRRRLSLFDNVILNSINRVIDDIASDGGAAEDLDESLLQARGRDLSFLKTLHFSKLKDILTKPLIEDAIVEGVWSVLTDVTNIPREYFSRDALRDVGDAFRNLSKGSRHSSRRQYPLIQEHRFKHGQWQVDAVTLSPEADSRKPSDSRRNDKNTGKEEISSANTVVQSTRNSATGDEEDEGDGSKVGDSIIRPLNNIFQMLRKPLYSALKKSGGEQEIKSVGEIADGSVLREASARDGSEDNREMEEEGVGNSAGGSVDVQKFNNRKDAKLKGDRTRPANHRKVEAPQNNPATLIPPEHGDLRQKLKSRYDGEETPRVTASTATEDGEMTERARDRTSDGTRKADAPSDEEIKVDGPSETAAVGRETPTRYDSSGVSTTTVPDLTKSGKSRKKGRAFLETTAAPASSAARGFHGKRKNILDLSSRAEDEEVENDVTHHTTRQRVEGEVKNSEPSGRDAIIYEQPSLRENTAEIPTATRQELGPSENKEPPKVRVQQEATTERANENLYATEETVRDGVLGGARRAEARYDERESRKTAIPVGDGAGTPVSSESSNLRVNIPLGIPSANDEVTGRHNFAPSSTLIDAVTGRDVAQSSSTSSVNDGTSVDSIDFYNERERSYDGEDSDGGRVEKTGYSSTTEETSRRRGTDSAVVMRARDEPPINYYSPNSRVLSYVKNRPADNEGGRVATGTAENFAPEISVGDARESLDDTTGEGKNSKSFASTERGHRRTKVTPPPTSSGEAASRAQQASAIENKVKAYDATSVTERPYGGATHFTARPFDPADDAVANSPAVTHGFKSAAAGRKGGSKNGSRGNDLIGGTNEEETAASEGITSAVGSSAGDSYSFEVFPASNVPDGSISRLQKSRLYYIIDGVKLPLEIQRSRDGTYVLSISKDICERILKRQCPFCSAATPGEPADRSQKEADTAGETAENYQSIYHLTPTITEESAPGTLGEEEEEEGARSSERRFLDGRKKRDFEKGLVTISMPIVDFAKKYNLSLDFNEDKILLYIIGLNDEIRNSDRSSTASTTRRLEHDRSSEGNNFDDNDEMRKSRILSKKESEVERFRDWMNTREKKDVTEDTGNSENLSGANRSEIVGKSKVYKLEISNRNVESENRASNPITQRINFPERKAKRKNERIKWDIEQGNRYAYIKFVLNIFHFLRI